MKNRIIAAAAVAVAAFGFGIGTAEAKGKPTPIPLSACTLVDRGSAVLTGSLYDTSYLTENGVFLADMLDAEIDSLDTMTLSCEVPKKRSGQTKTVTAHPTVGTVPLRWATSAGTFYGDPTLVSGELSDVWLQVGDPSSRERLLVFYCYQTGIPSWYTACQTNPDIWAFDLNVIRANPTEVAAVTALSDARIMEAMTKAGVTAQS